MLSTHAELRSSNITTTRALPAFQTHRRGTSSRSRSQVSTLEILQGQTALLLTGIVRTKDPLRTLVRPGTTLLGAPIPTRWQPKCLVLGLLGLLLCVA